MKKTVIYTPQPLIMLSEARKVLGRDSISLSDNQIEELILILTTMAEDYLQN